MRTVFVFVTSGEGLGHLSRALAVTKQLHKMDTELELMIITTSKAIETIREQGFSFFYIPGREDTPGGISYEQWILLSKALIRQMARSYEPIAAIYDTAYPYPWVLEVLEEVGVHTRIWIKRECDRPNMTVLNTLESQFDCIVAPKELERDVKENTGNKTYVAPIVQIEQEELLLRDLVRRQYGVKEEELFVYVQLGSGMVGNLMQRTREIVEYLLEKEGVRVLLGGYVMGERQSIEQARVCCCKEYPIAKYFQGIDLAICAAGYNTVHELLACHVPALLLPNVDTVVDDQEKRAIGMEQAGYAICHRSGDSIEQAIETLFEQRAKLQEAMGQYPWSNGAKEAANIIYAHMKK